MPTANATFHAATYVSNGRTTRLAPLPAPYDELPHIPGSDWTVYEAGVAGPAYAVLADTATGGERGMVVPAGSGRFEASRRGRTRRGDSAVDAWDAVT